MIFELTRADERFGALLVPELISQRDCDHFGRGRLFDNARNTRFESERAQTVVPKPTPPTDAQLLAFMKEHASQLTIPETRVITLVSFSSKALAPTVALDPGGRAPGRGAYLHRDGGCIGSARRRRSLERALKARVPEDIWQEIGL